MACGTTLVKYILFFFNFIFVIGGAILIAVGALTHTDQTKYVELVHLGKLQGPPIAMMVLGCVMFIIAFMGCCGAIRESNCMMMTYAIMLLILLVIEVAVAVLAIYYKGDLENLLVDGFTKSQKEYGSGLPAAAAQVEAWNEMQKDLKCCGVNDYTDWDPWVAKTPDSCCLKYSIDCAKDVMGQPKEEAARTIHIRGCVPEVLEQLKSEKIIMAAFILAAVELVGVIFACCLGARFRNKTYRNGY